MQLAFPTRLNGGLEASRRAARPHKTRSGEWAKRRGPKQAASFGRETICAEKRSGTSTQAARNCASFSAFSGPKAKAAGVYKGRRASIDAAMIRETNARGLGATAIAKALAIERSGAVSRTDQLVLVIYHSGRISSSTAGHSDAQPSGGVVLHWKPSLGWAGVSMLGCASAMTNTRYLPCSSDRIRGHRVHYLWPRASRRAVCSVDGPFDGISASLRRPHSRYREPIY